MWTYKYGKYEDNQIEGTAEAIQKQIFFLLLIVDPKTKAEYPNIDVNQAFEGLQKKLAGLNELLLYPPKLVKVMSLLEAAWLEYQKKDFEFKIYRKLILDAGSEVLKIKEV